MRNAHLFICPILSGHLRRRDENKLYDGRAFTQSVLDDFKELQEAGITHPDMEKIKALFAGKSEQ
jgi:hypothetical protein